MKKTIRHNKYQNKNCEEFESPKKDKIKIYCNSNNYKERIYIIDVLLKEFLDIDYEIELKNDIRHYIIENNGLQIIFCDAFFLKFESPLEYLNSKNLPIKPSYLRINLPNLVDVPVIYGHNTLEISNKNIYCGLDLFASAFFMLTRWEELFISKKTNWGSVDENEMYVVRHKLSKRPIVNEYCDVLKFLLGKINIIFVNKRKFDIMITHDVDYLFYYENGDKLIRKVLSSIKQLRLLETVHHAKHFLKYFIFRIDPFDSFNEIMTLSKSAGFINHFYFIPVSSEDNKLRLKHNFSHYDINDPRVHTIIKNIFSQGHKVGFHPSELTFKNGDQFRIELNRLRELVSKTSQVIEGGRQHQLLYDKDTYTTWDNETLNYDSSGFHFINGFRFGSCYEFSLFDITRRKKLNIKEKSIIIKEMMLNNLDKNAIIEDAKDLINIIYKYQGTVVLLWHTNNFNLYKYRKYKSIYKTLIKYLGALLSRDF